MDALSSRYGWRDVHRHFQVQVLRAGWDNTVPCSEHRKCPWAPGREHSTFVWGQDENTGGGRLIERLKEALKIDSRGGMYTNVVSVAGKSCARNFGKKSQQAVH